ncbi:hypothetical protein ES288_D12G306400v1 [Gossypium darwinii]|uniref:Protein kinase domain-containing protein n=1 Tax=Gossypium darwinii TaxID=34276 RepID=A0A5D2ADZ9_GOSDA|nr:hypothetical protein ES288_D12G306400v1 [Gossypium darwinii]
MGRSIPPLPAPPLQQPPLIYHQSPLPARLIFPPVAAVSASFSILLILSLCLRKIRRQRTNPAHSKPPHRYSYSVLRRATSSFSDSRRLGQGGFGSVYRATINNSNGNRTVAVKVMDAGSLQGEREFQNELFFASKLDSSLVVSVHGFSYDRKRRRMLLVYELMPHGNLQDALLHRKCPELMKWKQRFSIAVDIAKGLDYLHGLDPPIIHGDIKPSNILLDQNFSAKIADFGLARLKSEEIKVEIAEDYGSVAETESIATGIEEFNFPVDQSPVSVTGSPLNAEVVMAVVSPEPVAASPDIGSVSEGIFDKASVESGIELTNAGKHNNAAAAEESDEVKDYVMEWIGTEIKERPTSDWIASVAASSSSKTNAKSEMKKNKSKRRLEWWVSMEEDKEKNVKKEKRRPAREWWKEEYCEELAKKKKKKKKKKRQGTYNSDDAENWWPVDDELYTEKKKKSKRSRSKGSVGSVDWLWEGLSGELRRAWHDSFSGEIPKSGGASSTPSMRGTVCYVAPEYGGGGDVSEKCDVYSFGVLLLVLIAGRRPLQVTESPLSEFQRANLISWARRLARTGKLIDLVDQNVQFFNREQALLCTTVALLCLQKLPARRPSMKEVVSMLTGEAEPPQLPTEFSPSPPSRYPFKSRRKVR